MNAEKIPAGQHRRPYAGPMHRPLQMTPWVTLAVVALLAGALQVQSRPDGTLAETGRADVAVVHVTLTPVEVVGRRDAMSRAVAAASHANAAPGRVEPGTLEP